MLYTFAFEAVEEELRIMGILAIILGVSSLLFSLLFLDKNTYTRHIGGLAYFILGCVQVIPIMLWLRGTPVTDASETYQVTGLYSIPHIIILVTSIWCVFSLKPFSKAEHERHP